ncbi:MAG: hypothetical protein IIB73_02070 [Proteobacteria bacterium]|nr:hypothetical protein [Pseudomonadota bacterium]
MATYEKAFTAGTVHLIDVRVNYSENIKVLITKIAGKGLSDMSQAN